MIDKLKDTIGFLNKKGVGNPEIAVILGTGLGNFIHEISVLQKIPYQDIPHFPVSTVESHKGFLIVGNIGGKNIIAMQGRFHFYEGYSLAQVTYPVQVMKMLGVQKLLISNAAGALNQGFKKGELMLIDDHINFIPDNPLRGKNYNQLGPRFPDMSAPYSEKLGDILINIAEKNQIVLHTGVYVAVAGPNLETRAEYRMFRNYADAVGMSTVPEVIVANHVGIECAAISVLTDECDPDNLKPVSLTEILEIAATAEKKLVVLFKKLIQEI